MGANHQITPRPAFLLAMELISLVFHVAYCTANESWRDASPPNTAKWLEYSLTAALGVLALIPPTTFPTCDAYAATLVGVVSGGVLQQQAGKYLDIAGFEGLVYDPDKGNKWRVRFMFWGAVVWQIVEVVLVWEFSDTPGVGRRILVLLPYFVFYPAFGALCFFRLWEIRPRRHYDYTGGSSTGDGKESNAFRYCFEGLYSLLGTVAKITLLITTCVDLYAGHAYAQWVGLGSALCGCAAMAQGFMICYQQK